MPKQQVPGHFLLFPAFAQNIRQQPPILAMALHLGPVPDLICSLDRLSGFSFGLLGLLVVGVGLCDHHVLEAVLLVLDVGGQEGQRDLLVFRLEVGLADILQEAELNGMGHRWRYLIKLSLPEYIQIVNQRMLVRRPGVIKLANPNTTTLYQKSEDRGQNYQNVDFSQWGLVDFREVSTRINAKDIKQLCLDNNSISECALELAMYPHLHTLSLQNNSLTKFTLKKPLDPLLIPALTSLNLSHNSLVFVDVTAASTLTTLTLTHNCLSTMMLPQCYLTHLDLSHNSLSNIQYSVLNSKVFPRLHTIIVQSNSRSLYDLVLSVAGVQLVPELQCLNCRDNVISHVEGLPAGLRELDISGNGFVFGRGAVSEVMGLEHLVRLDIRGNSITKGFVEMIKGRKPGLLFLYEDGSNVQQSPYRIYKQDEAKPAISKLINSSNFTLGDCEQQIDPDYNLIVSPATQQPPPQPQSQNQKPILKQAQNLHKTHKFTINIDGTRYHNHYKYYFNQLKIWMTVPPCPVRHQQRTHNLAVRIDPSNDNTIVNQFDLINEMLKSKGGIHYLRKVYNWALTIKSQNNPQYELLFINSQFNKAQFDQLLDGDYQQLDEVLQHSYHLSQQPCNFTCFHILGRISHYALGQKWTCVYLIESVHM